MIKSKLAEVGIILMSAITTLTVTAGFQYLYNVEVSTEEVVIPELGADDDAVGSASGPNSVSIISLEVAKNRNKSIRIDSDLFTTTSIELNTEIYNITADVINQEHLDRCFGTSGTNLYDSYSKYINPMMPLALTIMETGTWADTSVTWSSAIYSKLFINKGVDLSSVSVDSANTDMYLANGLSGYLGCGTNCTASTDSHYDSRGYNDNDSLGPLQILRHYIEGNGGVITYSCGEQCSDLMLWRDNVEYFFHSQTDKFASESNWNKDYTIQNEYELMALMAVAHNTGSAYLTASGANASAGSLWKSASSVYEFCSNLASDSSMEKLGVMVDEWYEYVEECVRNGQAFLMPSQYFSDSLDSFLEDIDLTKSDYTDGFRHKQYYPVKAVMNYMGLQRLYYSGY